MFSLFLLFLGSLLLSYAIWYAWWCHFSEAAKYISLHPESYGMPWWFDLPPEQRDAAAIRSDWQVVGNDMRKVIQFHRDEFDDGKSAGFPDCTCPTLNGHKIIGSSCRVHGLKEATWSEI